MEAPAVVNLGPRLVPTAIRHARLDLSWQVLRVLENWTSRQAAAGMIASVLSYADFVRTAGEA